MILWNTVLSKLHTISSITIENKSRLVKSSLLLFSISPVLISGCLEITTNIFDKIGYTAGIAPFIIIPGDNFNKVILNYHRG